ncbi:unnamed protein product, partial [Rhizoctonia solani]
VCCLHNFLNLPYVVMFEPDGTLVWRDAIGLGGPGGVAWDRPQKIVHFARITSRAEGAISTCHDGRFTREFCSIHANESISLAERVRKIRQYLDSATEQEVVHLYSCHKWDMESKDPLGNWLLST